MSLLKRKPKVLPTPSNTEVVTTLSSSEEDTISLCSRDESEDKEYNPFVEGEKKLVVLPKQLTRTFVCTTLIAVVCAVLSGVSVGIHIEYRERCNTSDAFGMFGICLLVFMTVRYTTSAVFLGVATYRSSKINKTCGFQKLAEQYKSMLEKVNVGSVMKRKSTSATKATIEMGRKIDMFNYIRALTASRRPPPPPPHTDITHNVLLNAMSSLKACHLLNEDSCKYAYSQRGKDDDKTRLLYIMAGIDTVPLLSLIFFIFVGTETELLQETSICVVSLAFNWTLVAIFILFCAASCTSLFFRILQCH